LFIDLMPHLMDQALQLFGEPEALSADIATLRDGTAGNGAAGDDFAQVHLRYASGLRVNLHASTLAAMPGPRFELQGTRGAWRSQWLDPQEDALRAGLRPDTAPPGTWGQHPQPERRQSELVLAEDPSRPDSLRPTPWPLRPGDYPAYYAGIVAALRGKGPNPVPAEEALRVMHWLDVAREAAQQGRCLRG
jgi:predicted dehydrogenase